MGKKIIRPIKGIDVDSGLNRRDDNSIYMAKNLRVNSNDGVSTGEYTNIKGAIEAMNIFDEEEILKIYKIHDNIVIFLYDNSSTHYIALVKESDIPKNGETKISINVTDYYWNGTPGQYHKIIEGDLGFSLSEDIEVKAYYEDDNTQKIYWTTAGEPLRSLNIIYSDSNDPSIFTPEDLEASPIADLDIPLINNTISGNLLTGKIYYAYTLINSIGAESNLSELSFPYHITKASEEDVNDYEYKGYGFDVNSGKGINLTISSIPSSFNRLKLYSIHYIDDVSVPLIKLIYDGFASETLTINDYGTALLELTPEEFIGKNNLFSKDGQLEIKNNRLFLANYTEEFFDIDEVATGEYWDARSYRFNASNTTALIYESNLTTSYTIDSANYTIDEDHDAINLDNDINRISDTITLNNYYKANSTALGSSGPNIIITQKAKTFSDGDVEPDASNENIKWYAKTDYYGDYDSYATPKQASRFRTFKLEEVYRLSIQFKNSKGQLSYPKWITDYKFVYDASVYTPINWTGSILEVNRYFLDIDVQNIPIDPITGAPYEYRIMYVPITESDQSVFWGLFNKIWKTDGADNYRTVVTDYQLAITASNICSATEPSLSINYKYTEFISPDYCFGNKKQYSKMRFLLRSYYGSAIGGNHSDYQSNTFKLYDYSNTEDGNTIHDVDNQYDISYNINIEDSVSLSGSDSFNRSGSTVAQLYGGSYYTGCSGGADKIFGNSNKGRCQIIKGSNILSSYNFQYSSVFGCAYIDNFQSKSGGLGYSARKSNGYVALNAFGDSSEVVWGDSTAGVFEYLRQISDNNQPYIKNNQDLSNAAWDIHTDKKYLPGSAEIIVFPTYTNTNLKLRSDDYYTKVFTQDGAYMLHEYAGVYEDNIKYDGNPGSDQIWITNKWKKPFTQETDLYLYNKTYSREQDLFKYYEKPILNSIITDFKNRIISSQHKILGESADSFLKIDPGQYIDVDGQYGEIKDLKVFNDRLYFFQDDAIGIVAVNEKATTNITDGSELILGTIGLLSRYDYITTSNGINNNNHVAISNKSMYVIDEVRKQILKIDNNGIEKISVTKNINSLVNSVDLTNARIVYNRKFNEILFYYIDPDSATNQLALVYNEQSQQFTSIYSNYKKIIDSVHIDRTDLYDELLLNNNDELLVLNDGNYNKFDALYAPSEITFLVAANQENVVLFNVIEFIAKQVDSSGDAVTDFIDTIRIYNAECDTGELDFSINSKYKFGKYRTDKLRNYTNAKPKERMLSDHIYVTIKTKDNSTTQDRVYFRDLITSFSEYNYFGY